MNKRKKRFLATCIILVFVVAVSISYVNNYYHANEMALRCIDEPATSITVSEEANKCIVFEPEDATIGFIFYPGGKVQYEAYAPLMERLADEGVLCILLHMPANLAVLDVNAADGVREKFSEIQKWYIGGHSLGGSMAASYLAEHTEEYEGLILLASYSTADLRESELAVLSIYGENDEVLNEEKYIEYKTNLPSDFEEIIIEGGNHAYFGSYGLQKGDGAPKLTNEEQIRITADEILFRLTL